MDETLVGQNQFDMIAKALVEFHRKVGVIKKDSVNPFFQSKYAALPDILTAVDPILVQCNLAVVQIPVAENELDTILLHTSGQSISGRFKFTPKDTSPQSLGSAITYARRYALGAILSLNVDEDDDGNAASGRSVTVPAKKDEPPFETPPSKTEPISKAQVDLIAQLVTKHREDGQQYASLEEFEEASKISVKALSKAGGAKLIDQLLNRIKEIDEKK